MCRVLVVDDADSNRWIMGRLLRHCGHEAFCADNGESALSRCENQTPDIVLLDLQMPVMDGLTFLKTIRADDRWKDLPVIVVTSVAARSSIGISDNPSLIV